MTAEEKRAGASLAAVFALRMLGLFLILPVFAVHAKQLAGGNNPLLIGLTLGAYGLTQAIFQIPFGLASDRLGRKPVILFGLMLFALGSAVAALTDDLGWILIGRVLQGMGAISAAVTALAADLTREQHRTKIMATIGSSIGLVFALSLVIAPKLYAWVGMSGMFWLIAILSVSAMAVVAWVVPAPPSLPVVNRVPFAQVLGNAQLLRLNFGVFCLHMVQMSLFVVVPSRLIETGELPLPEHWKVYLPAVLLSFVLMVPAIIIAERRNKIKQVFQGAIALLVVTLTIFLFGQQHFVWLGAGLLLFFVGFNILEATLPSLVSRIAPGSAKGAALGIYNTTQALGLFAGGALGGFLSKVAGSGAVFAADAGVFLIWLLVAMTMADVPLRKSTAKPASHGILREQ